VKTATMQGIQSPGGVDDETLAKIFEHDRLLKECEDRLHRAEWKGERVEVQTNQAQLALNALDNTVSSLRDAMPKKADQAQLEAIEKTMLHASMASSGKTALPNGGAIRPKIEPSKTKQAKFFDGTQPGPGASGEGSAELRVAINKLESQMLMNMAFCQEIEHRVKSAVQHDRLQEALDKQWEQTMALFGGDEDALAKLSSRLSNIDIETSVIGASISNHEARLDELENNPHGGMVGATRRAAMAFNEAAKIMNPSVPKGSQKDQQKFLEEKFAALGDTITQAWVCVQDFDQRLEDAFTEGSALRAKGPVASEVVGSAGAVVMLREDGVNDVDAQQTEQIREMEAALKAKGATDEQQTRILEQVEAAVLKQREDSKRQDKDLKELRELAETVEGQLGELLLRDAAERAEAAPAPATAPDGGASGAPTPATQELTKDVRNMLSMMRTDRAIVKRVSKDFNEAQEQLDDLQLAHRMLKSDVAQKAGIKDIKSLADGKDLEQIRTMVENALDVIASKADKAHIQELIDASNQEFLTKNLDTADVYSDEDMQVRVAVNSQGSMLAHITQALAQCRSALASKADAEGVDVLRQMLQQLRTKVERPAQAFGSAESHAISDIEALKRNVTNLFREQKRTDAQQSADIHVLKEQLALTEGKRIGVVPDEQNQEDSAGKAADKALFGSGGGLVNEGLVQDVAHAVTDVFKDKFKRFDNQLKKKVDRMELRMILAGKGNDSVGRDPEDIDPRSMPPTELNSQTALMGADDGITDNYYVTSALGPRSVPQQVRKYAGRSLSPPTRPSDPNFKLPLIGPGNGQNYMS